MQKKSLLVALFCGALCLTGCLKNEESASVALVRGAKAEELKSLAALNNAKAAAEAVYAQAELTVANAEAELRKAQANLINAQAETERVRAELLKVRVALAEVQVDEEKKRLQMLEADLEQKLAEVEAAVAKAEFEKQQWVNKLENLLAQAEVDAIRNAKRVLEAEQKLEEYLLTLAKDKADSAKAASVKYFAALDEVQNLQKEQIETKAMKALVEAGALQVREAIYKEMGKIDEKIAIYQARVDYLKEYQTYSPEEIEAELEEAWKAVNDAYALYLTAVDAANDAETAKNDAVAVESTYVEDWSDNFADVVRGALKEMAGEGYRYAADWDENTRKYVFVDEETDVKYNAYVKFDEDGEVEEIVPLWTAKIDERGGKEQHFDEPVFPEVIDGIYQKYPEFPGIDVTTINNRTYYPAKIEFENIQKVFDAYEDWQENVVLKAFDENVDKYTEWQKNNLQSRIDWLTEAKDYFQSYVDNRQDIVDKAEKALADSIASAKKIYANPTKAFAEYQNYMVLKYDVDRERFEDRYKAKLASDKADEDSIQWGRTLAAAKTRALMAFGNLEAAELKAHEAVGAYEAAKKAVDDYTIDEAALATARTSFDDRFDSPSSVASVDDTVWVSGHLFRTTKANSPYAGKARSVKEADKDASRPAGATQEAYYKAEIAMNLAEKALRDAKWLKAYYTGYGDTEKAAAEDAKIPALEGQYDDAKGTFNQSRNTMASAEKVTKGILGAYAALEEDRDAKEKLWKDAVKNIYAETVFNTETEKVDTTAYGRWYYAVQDTLVYGTTGIYQIPLKTNLYDRGNIGFNIVNHDPVETSPLDPETEYTTAQKAAYYAAQHHVKAADLQAKEAFLLHLLAYHMNVEEKDITSTEDKEADRLYKAWQDAEENQALALSKINDGLERLLSVYFWRLDQYNSTSWFENVSFWANASYQLDPNYQYIHHVEWNEDENDFEIVKYFYHGVWDNKEKKWVGDRENSIAAQLEDAQAELADEKKFAEDCKADVVKYWYNNVNPYDTFAAKKVEFETATKNLAKYEAVETAYVNSVKDRNTTHAAWVEATLEELIADGLYKIEREEYLALKDLANEGIWVYDPERNICKEVYGHKYQTITSAQHNGEFTFVPIATEIENLEGEVKALQTGVSALFTIAKDAYEQYNNTVDNQKVDINELKDAYEALKVYLTDSGLPASSIAELNFTKNVLEQALKYGKVALQVVVDAFDAEIAELDEQIEVYTKIAEIYKAIMNAYLGIVDEADVAGETGPLEGEGDDEE